MTDTQETQSDSIESHSDDTEVVQMAVCADLATDPHPNYTIVGRIVEIDLADHDTHSDAAVQAARQATNAMTERPEDILDDEVRVFTLAPNFTQSVPVSTEVTTEVRAEKR